MSILDVQKRLMTAYLPQVYNKPGGDIFSAYVPATIVFAAVRELSTPPMTAEEFDLLADELAVDSEGIRKSGL